MSESWVCVPQLSLLLMTVVVFSTFSVFGGLDSPTEEVLSLEPIFDGGSSVEEHGQFYFESTIHREYNFKENLGQLSNPTVHFFTNIGRIQAGFSKSEILFNLFEPTPSSTSLTDIILGGRPEIASGGISFQLTFDGANQVDPVGRGVAPFLTNYFIGNDPMGWQTGLHSYREVIYPDLYHGVDLIWGTSEGSLKYEFLLHADAKLDSIRIVYKGIKSLSKEGTDLVIHTSVGDLRDTMPLVYQTSGRPVDCHTVLLDSASVGFSCEGWDERSMLVIDPIVYGTYLGGSDWDYGIAIAADLDGYAYVTGYTRSTDFPTTPGAFDSTLSSLDLFVARFSPVGDLMYATYLGGDGFDRGLDISADARGYATVSGITESPNFPTTPTAFDTTIGGSQDGFIVQLDDVGSNLVFATYFGGDNIDSVTRHSSGPGGDIFMSGYTLSDEGTFPVTPGAFDTTFNSILGPDAYVARMDANGTTLIFASYLGGSSGEYPVGIFADIHGNAYVTGQVITDDGSFPVTPGAFDTTHNGGWDIFVAKMNATDLLFATFLGGDSNVGDDTGLAVVADEAGNVFVAGRVGSNETTFPVTPGAYDTKFGGFSHDGFIASFVPDGTALRFCTYLGGSIDDYIVDMTLNPLGGVYVVGTTGSTDFPRTADAFDITFEGSDAFLSSLDDTGSNLTYSTFIGGGGPEEGNGVAIDTSGNLYVTGLTSSTDFPVTPGAFDTTSDGVRDGFVIKFGAVDPIPPLLEYAPTSLNFGIVLPGYLGNLTFQVRNAGGSTLAYQLSESTPWLSINPSLGNSLWEWDTIVVSIDTLTTGHGALSAPVYIESNGGSGVVWVNVTVNRPPTAIATVQPSLGNLDTSFTFDGSLSSDPDDDPLNYSWELGDGSVAYGQIIIHIYQNRGGFNATLLVTDLFGLSDSTEISIIVVNRPPIADAGQDQTVFRNVIVELDGSASTDPDGDLLAVTWTQISGPTIILSASDESITTFVPTLIGVYTFDLTVNDGRDAAVDTVVVEVVNRPPQVFAGPDLNDVLRNHVVNLAALGWDPDGDALIYEWIQTNGTQITLEGSGTSSVTFTPRLVGAYEFTVTATDSLGGIATDSVLVVVMNLPPQADAGPNQTLALTDDVFITGIAWDLDGDSLTILWVQEDGPTVSLAGETTKTLRFTPTAVGEYVFRFTVDDGHGGQATDMVTITVTQPELESSGLTVIGWFLGIVAILVILFLLALYLRRRHCSEEVLSEVEEPR